MLRADGASGLGPAGGPEAVLARQVQALGQPGDLLLLLDTDGADAAWLPLVQAAHEADVNVVAIAGQGCAGLRGALGETDVLVAVPQARRARVAELQLLALHCLCDAIDLQLMGEQEPT